MPLHRIWTRRNLYAVSACWLVFYAGVWFLDRGAFIYIRICDMAATYVALALVDWKRRMVPDSILVCFLAGQILMGALVLWPRELLNQILSGGLFMGVLACIAWFSKGRIGMGDVKLLGVTSMVCGWNYAAQILCWAFVPAFLYSIGLLLFRRVSMKTEISFVPFLMCGIILHMAARIYFI